MGLTYGGLTVRDGRRSRSRGVQRIGANGAVAPGIHLRRGASTAHPLCIWVGVFADESIFSLLFFVLMSP